MPFGIGRALGGIVRTVGGIAGGPIGRPLSGTVASILEGGRGGRGRNTGINPAASPGYTPYQPTGAAPSTGELQRFIQDTLGGAVTGGFPGAILGGAAGVIRNAVPSQSPYSGSAVSPSGSLMLAESSLMPVEMRSEARAPKGYRVHTVTVKTAPLVGMPVGSKVAVKLGSDAAKILKVKRAKKPPISVSQNEALRKAEQARKKYKALAQKAGWKVLNK